MIGFLSQLGLTLSGILMQKGIESIQSEDLQDGCLSNYSNLTNRPNGI